MGRRTSQPENLQRESQSCAANYGRLAQGLDQRGCKTSFSNKDQSKTEVDVNGIKIGITLREDFKRFERDAAAPKKKNYYESDLYYYKPSGSFTFSITNSHHTQQNWRDGKSAVLEDQINNIVVGIFRAADDLRQREIDSKNEEVRQFNLAIEREKNKILIQRQVDCRELFTELMTRWQKSQEILKFISDYETKIIEKNGTIQADSDELKLIEWAKDYAEKLNPIEANRMVEVIEKIKHLHDEPHEDESHEYSNLRLKP